MKFCPVCSWNMQQITTNNKLEFQCKRCHETVDGNDEDVWIDGESYDQQETEGMYDRLFKNAVYDRTCCNIITPPCSVCNVNIMKLVRVGDDQSIKIMHLCKNDEVVSINNT